MATAITIPQHPHSISSSSQTLAIELAKVLKLVAPISMSGEAQLAWIASAVDALEDIRPDEVKAISAELRRTVTRPAQIVPEIARLVSDRRSRRATQESLARQSERVRRAEDVPSPPAPPLTRAELESVPDHIRKMGLNGGFLRWEGGKLVEVSTA